MLQRYFELHDDVNVPRRWHLKNPADAEGRELDDPWQFTSGKLLQLSGRLRIPVEHAGRPLDFSEAGLGIPVVHVKVASLFSELAPGDVQLIPVEIDGQPDQYLILVVTNLIRCIDEAASKVRFWTAEHGVPHKIGKYIAVDRMRIDKAKVGAARVFRTEGWEGSLIVSGDIKAALESVGATGLRFEEV
jgi:hypothetical protein